MEQSAVEFLLENIEILIKQGHTFNPIFKYYFIEQAKEMEKQQIIDAISEANKSNNRNVSLDSEKYYNETFKKKEQ